MLEGAGYITSALPVLDLTKCGLEMQDQVIIFK
jgi:hypothetical protein